MFKLNYKNIGYLSKIKWILILLFFAPQNSHSSRNGSLELSRTGVMRSGGTKSIPATQDAGTIMPTSNNYMNHMLTFPGAVNDLKDTLINGKDIDFEKNTNLTWPPLPRAWLEYHTIDYISSNTYAGFKLTPQLFMFNSTIASKLNFDFKYQVKSSFVAIANRSSKSPTESSKKQFEYDDKYMQTYLKPNSGPLVGLCIYEVSFTYDKGLGFSLDLMGSGQSLSAGRVEGITNTHFSSFFEIEEDHSSEVNKSKLTIDQYKASCIKYFNNEIKPQVTADMSRQIMQFVFHRHPKSQCTPTFDEVHPEGDPSCQTWFKENINEYTRKLTIPRCNLQNGGYHSCTLTAKQEGVSCPIYQNSDGSYSDQKLLPDSRRISSRNNNNYSFPCDEKLGLRCNIIKEPTFLGKIILSDGKARCQRAY